jgi:tetratricopeptide (TPR) repeat protein
VSALLLTLLLAQDPQVGRYTPAEAQALFNEASEAYSRQDFATAQARYEQLINAGMGGPAVLYNLGTTHLAANQLGPAVLYLERARAMSHDEDIGANLAQARQKQGDQVVGAKTAEPFAQRLAGAMNVQAVAGTFLAMWYLGFALAFLAWFRPASRDGKEISKLPDGALSKFRRDRLGFIFQFFNLLPR